MIAMTKICSKCGQEKDLQEFHRNKKSKDGRHSHCKACRLAHNKEYNKRKYREMSPRIVIATTKTCPKCGQEKNIEEFHRSKRRKDGRYWCCKACRSEYNKKRYRKMSPLERSAYNMARNVVGRTGVNGKYTKKGIKNLLGNQAEIERFLLENFSQDIQAILDKGETPSIDRIDPKGHYEPGNVRVIPHRLNSKLGAIKSKQVAVSCR